MLLHIQELLDQKWMYASELAEAIGCGRQTMSRYLNGRAFPKEKRLRDIARVLGVPVWRLFVDPNEDVPHVDYKGYTRCPHCDRKINITFTARRV